MLKMNELVESFEGFDVFVCGSANIDLISTVVELPKIGETIFGMDFTTEFGGKGANQATQCARLGMKVALCCKLGLDSHGQNYRSQFSKEKISQKCVLASNSTHTGTAIITVASSGENTIVVIPGSNSELSVPDILSFENEVSNSKVFVCQNEVPLSTNLAGLSLAKQHGCLCIFNTAPANASMSKELFRYSDIICPNETELATLTGLNAETENEIRIAAIQLLQDGISPDFELPEPINHLKCVVVTMGKRGACIVHYVYDSSLDPSAPVPHPRSIKCLFVPTVPVLAVDTVGAGDSFVGALASSLATYLQSFSSTSLPLPPSPSPSPSGRNDDGIMSIFLPCTDSSDPKTDSDTPIVRAVKEALRCASWSVTRRGVQRSYPTKEDLIL